MSRPQATDEKLHTRYKEVRKAQRRGEVILVRVVPRKMAICNALITDW